MTYEEIRALMFNIGGDFLGIGRRLKEAREKAGLTQDALGKMVGVTGSSITNYEKETSHPKEPVMYALMDTLGIDPNFLFQDCVSTVPKEKRAAPHYTCNEDTAESVCKRYKALDSHGKQVVCAVMTEEERRIKAVAKEPVVIELFPMRHYIQSASAGLGDFSDDDSFEVVDLVKRPPAGASFLATVNGDSMEPTYHDGQWVFIRAQETLQYGEIGLFAIGADLYIKEYGVNGLISHNPAYAVRQPPADTPARIYGKVLGVCSSDYFR